ncbi:glycosyltransferase [Roseisalinus antarcticus]|uniref:GDP-mannose-dependent alpha-(1-6)-phosphatidylinositol monomannoside mannosyltransferase n=1 Tax=Roseisalinus antarcticus TaxID=254357 RepID=A0A1Y5TYP5_9RHOB|nr:glycosyltransferase [Roseisalinus antarcticus]SLN76036.1 GDP-mannose-dependent alpha-(1-6)-phosphatidylinositol monomannoside mannosyltransferase [Roseisalinus antarcticus]
MPKSERPPVLGIVTSTYHRSGETFVNHHIDRLLGGNTVVVCNRFSGENPYDRPVFDLTGGPTRALDRLLAPPAMLTGYLRHRALNLPHGARRRDLAAFLREHEVRVILAEFGNRAIQIAPLANALGIPIFAYFRGFDASKLLREPLFVPAYKRLMPRLAGVFSVSQFLLDNLGQHGIRHANARVVPSGADTSFFVPGDKVPAEAVAVGRFVDKKAPQVTIQAFLDGARHVHGAHLHMIGDGPLLEPCRRMAEAKAPGRITFHGAQDRDTIRDRLARASLFLQHSVTEPNGNTEGLPSSIQEAMAAGCAVVSTRHAGIPEAVTEGMTGRLVDEHDNRGFATAIGDLLHRPETAIAMGVSARRVAVERFNKTTLTQRIEKALHAAL